MDMSHRHTPFSYMPPFLGLFKQPKFKHWGQASKVREIRNYLTRISKYMH